MARGSEGFQCHILLMAFLSTHNTSKTRSTPTFAGELGEGLLALLWPKRCIGCDMPGASLCTECESKLILIDQSLACPCCGAPFGAILCTECWSADGRVEHPFSLAVCAMEHEGLGVRVVTFYKDSGERGLCDHIVRLIAEALCERPDITESGIDVLTYVPASKRAVSRRGFDHMRPIAEALGRKLDLSTERLLTHSQVEIADQRSLGRLQRASNMRGAFTVSEKVSGRVLLVDDVLTTGSTLSSAAEALLDAGAGEVVVATACRVW